MKKIVLNVIAAALMVVGLGVVAQASPAYAGSIVCPNGEVKDSGDYKDCNSYSNSTGVFKNQDLMGTLQIIINVVVGVVGFVAVAMIVMGGISFATSQGDTAKTTKARNTVLYGVVGLVVALLAFAIVNFVLSNVFSAAQ